jgi:hypothetical protein
MRTPLLDLSELHLSLPLSQACYSVTAAPRFQRDDQHLGPDQRVTLNLRLSF